MSKSTPALFLIAISLLSATADASEKYAGAWEMQSMSLSVAIESWGPNCGPEPRSYGSKKVRPVDIVSRGAHLIFSKGGVRTDRCWSPNPRIHSVSEKATPGNWQRACETSKNDPKYERGDYSLIAHGLNKLNYRARSKFDWTLTGDHCVAKLDERRLYLRKDSASSEKSDQSSEKTPPAEPEPVPEKDTVPGPTIDTDVDEIILPVGCESPDSPKRLAIHAGRTEIGPGQTICFKCIGTDAKGCSFPVKAVWSTTQKGDRVSGLMGQEGCFRAGLTAAESEGEYEITARFGGRTDTIKIRVIFPDLGELLAARLRPLDDLEDAPDKNQNSPENKEKTQIEKLSSPSERVKTPQSIEQFKQFRKEESGGSIFWFLAVFFFIAMIAVLGLVFIILRKSKISLPESDNEENEHTADNLPDDQFNKAESTPVETDPVSMASSQRGGIHKMICPNCNRNFPLTARFCPHDGGVLVQNRDISTASVALPKRGKVCPTCHRGYEEDARFCPHDSSELISYNSWKDKQR